MKVVIIGVGLIGKRRGRIASAHPRTEPVIVVDTDKEKAMGLAGELGCEAGTDWKAAVCRRDVDIVVAATPNNILAPVSIAALKAGKHVFCEKPMATRLEDAELMIQSAETNKVALGVGYTLRHHQAVLKAKELLSSGTIGEPMYIRACYGHGGRTGYEKEWRCNRGVSGGGELIDQGVHLIDLSRWFLGDFVEAFGKTTTSFWDISPLEDNIFATLTTEEGKVATIHASWTQWRNRFSFEIFGDKGYLIIDGLGGSYGPERLIVGKRDAGNPPPKEESRTFESDDLAWHKEWEEFVEAVEKCRKPPVSGRDAYEILRIAHAIYRSDKDGKVVKIR